MVTMGEFIRDTLVGPEEVDATGLTRDELVMVTRAGSKEAGLQLLRSLAPKRSLDARHLPGKHDQKTHGHGGGAGNTKKWNWDSYESDWQGEDGPIHVRQWTYNRHVVTDMESGYSKEEIEGTILPRLQQLQESNPLPNGETIDLRLEKRLESRNPALGATAGLTRLGTGHIAMSGEFAGMEVSDDQIPFNTPAAKGRLWSDYVLVHEWGHAIDESKSVRRGLFGVGSPGTDFIPNEYGEKSIGLFEANIQAPSDYGKTSVIESHAESFAEFYLTGGKTLFAAPRIYAKELGWDA